jgi:hypothetical protein
MPDLKFAVLFSAIDQISDKLGHIGDGIVELGNQAQRGGERIGEMGERLTRFGENAALTAVLASEGANKMHEWTDAIFEPALAMDKVKASVTAMTGIAGPALDELAEHAIKFSNAHAGITSEEWLSGFTRFRGIYQDTSKAIAAEDIAAKLGKMGVSGSDAINLLTVAGSNFHENIGQIGDQLARTYRAFGLAPESMSQFTQGLGKISGGAAAANATLPEVLALQGEAAHLLGGGRGSAIFSSLVDGLENAANKGKVYIDFSHGLISSFEQLGRQLHGTDTQKLAELQDMKIGNPQQMLRLINHLGEVKTGEIAIANGAANLDTVFNKTTNNAIDQAQRLHQNVVNLADAIASPDLGGLQRTSSFLADMVGHITDFAKSYPATFGGAALALKGFADTGYYGVQALSALGTVSVVAGKGLQAIQWAGKLLDFESWALRAMYFGEAIRNLEIGTKLWTAAQWALDAAMGANPIGIAVVGAAALAGIGYEIYEHWSGIANFFESTWAKVQGIFSGAVTWMESAGSRMIKGLGDGMLSMIEWPIHAAEKLAGKIGGYFIGRSPPPYGPLHELGRVRIMETIAERLGPGPALSALGRTAGAIALAAPLLAAPSMAMAAPSAATPWATAGIVINAPITINAPNGDAEAIEKVVVKAFDRHRYELARAVEKELARRDRTKLQ